MNLLSKRRGVHAVVVLAVLAMLFPLAVSAQEVRVEIQIRNSFPHDDYLTWSPAQARIRIVPGATPGRDRLVVLTNDPQGPIPEGRTAPLDGDVLFAESVRPGQTATQETLKLVLPGNGTWREFVIAGKFGRASTRDKDAIVQVHLDAATGPVVGTHPLMVRIRKDARTLTPGERDRLLQAIAHVRWDLETYETFVNVHDQAAKGKIKPAPDYWPDQSHRMAGFLPWHRAFLLQFERELQKDFPDVALPYWRLSEPSNVFTSEFLGGNRNGGGEVVPAELSPSNPLQFWEIDGEPLMRFATDRNSASELSQFSTESQSLSSSDGYARFRRAIESNPHNNGHNWVGPWMQNCMISPRDPLFWVFHSEFDRLWAKWQWTYGRLGNAGAEPKDYEPVGTFDRNAAGCTEPKPNGCVPLGHWLKDRMWPWDETSGPGVNYGATRPPQRFGKFPASPVPGLWPAADMSPMPADMIDYEAFNTGVKEMGFAYDDVPFGMAPKPLFQPEAVQAAAPPSEAVPLGRLLADREQPDEIRVAALRRLVNQDAAAAVDRALQILGNPQDGGGELDAEAVDLLNVQMMFTDEGTQRHGEIHAALRKALTDPRRLVRVTALRNLATHGDPDVVKVLTDSLARPEGAPFAPAEAIRTLTVAGIGDNAAAVRPYLDSPDPDTRAAAVTALLADPVSQPRIVAMIADASQPLEVREAAVAALARGVPGAAEAVTALLADPATDPRLRARAEAAVAFRQRSQKKETR
ncbi:MAG: tyrosinase family protein [Thermoanaerobaculia bacterium]